MKSIKESICSSHAELRNARANLTIKNLEMASKQNISERIMRYRADKLELENLLDFGDDNVNDICVKIKNIAPTYLISKIYDDISRNLFDHILGIMRCVYLHKKLFPNTPIEELDENDMDGFEWMKNFFAQQDAEQSNSLPKVWRG